MLSTLQFFAIHFHFETVNFCMKKKQEFHEFVGKNFMNSLCTHSNGLQTHLKAAILYRGQHYHLLTTLITC